MSSRRQGRPRGWQRFVVVALLLHIPLFAYPVLRLCAWFELGWMATTLIFMPLFFNQIIARVLLRGRDALWAGWLRTAADICLGISPVVLCLVLLAEVPVWLAWLQPREAAWLVLGSAIGLTIYSVFNAWSPSVVTVQLPSSKDHPPLRFVQISDVHIGSRSQRFLEHVIDKVNALDPEFLCITECEGPRVDLHPSSSAARSAAR